MTPSSAEDRFKEIATALSWCPCDTPDCQMVCENEVDIQKALQAAFAEGWRQGSNEFMRVYPVVPVVDTKSLDKPFDPVVRDGYTSGDVKRAYEQGRLAGMNEIIDVALKSNK